MTTPPTDTTEPAAADQVLTERCDSSAQYLAGLIADGMLDTVGRPDKLPALLFPDVDPWIVDQIWKAALPVGVWVGKAMTRPVWDQAALDRLRTALAEAGYQSMATRAARTANHARRHPHHDTADGAVPVPHPADNSTVRDGSHP